MHIEVLSSQEEYGRVLPSEEVHLSLPDLHSTPHSSDLDVVTESYSEAVGEHSKHPFEVLLLRRRGETQIVQVKSFTIGGLTQDICSIILPAICFQKSNCHRV